MIRNNPDENEKVKDALKLLGDNFGEIGKTGHQLHFGNRLKPEPAWWM
jgi:hypothetical protein